MKTVKTTLSAELQDYLAAAPGETDSAKLHWVVNFWASTVDEHRTRKKAEEAAAFKQPQLELLHGAADEAIRDMSSGEQPSAEVMVATALDSSSTLREMAEAKA